MIGAPRRMVRRLQRGQAAVECALLAPVLCMMALGAYDIGHFSADSSMGGGQMRAGLSMAETSATSDVGASVRTAACGASATFCAVPNDLPTWGVAWTGKADSCAGGTPPCGDPSGCVAGSSFWTSGGYSPTACFSVGFCTLAAGPPPTCTPITWATARAPHAGTVVTRVVLKRTPATAEILQMVSAGTLYITATGVGSAFY